MPAATPQSRHARTAARLRGHGPYGKDRGVIPPFPRPARLPAPRCR